jgi:hypothetical protein
VAAIGSGVIATADIADDAVSLAKMASGTDGNVISYDTSGNPVAVATGTDGQVLTSSGAGAVCAFEDAAGGAWSFVSTAVASSSSTIEITGIDNTSDLWMVVISGSNVSNDVTTINCRTSNDTSSWSYDSGASDYSWNYQGAASGTGYAKADSSDSEITLGEDPFTMGNDATNSWSGFVYLHAPSVTTYDTQLSWLTVQMSNAADPAPQVIHGTGLRKAAEAVTAIQFYMSAGSFDTGRFSLYKLAHA